MKSVTSVTERLKRNQGKASRCLRAVTALSHTVTGAESGSLYRRKIWTKKHCLSNRGSAF